MGSPDPAGLSAVDLSNPQTMNRYVYVANNPLSNMDPRGLCTYGQTGSYMTPNGPVFVFGCLPTPPSVDTSVDPGAGGSVLSIVDSSMGPGSVGPNGQTGGGVSGASGAQSSPCGGSANKGYGFGFLASAGAFFGLGRGAAASGSVGVGYFHTDTHYGSGNMLGGFKGGGAFTVPSQNPPSNLAMGFQAGAGAGLFYTNAGNAQSMGGPGTAYQVSVPFFSIEYDTSPGGIWAVSLTGGEGKGLQAGFLKIQTNSKGTTFTCGAPY